MGQVVNRMVGDLTRLSGPFYVKLYMIGSFLHEEHLSLKAFSQEISQNNNVIIINFASLLQFICQNYSTESEKARWASLGLSKLLASLPMLCYTSNLAEGHSWPTCYKENTHVLILVDALVYLDETRRGVCEVVLHL